MTMNLLKPLQKRDGVLYRYTTLQGEPQKGQQTSAKQWRVLRAFAGVDYSHTLVEYSVAHDTEKYDKQMTDIETRNYPQHTQNTSIAIVQSGLQSGSNHKIVLSEEASVEKRILAYCFVIMKR